MFKFKSYYFNPATYLATFEYEGNDGVNFVEKIQFRHSQHQLDAELLDRAMFLSFILIGTSYYKAHPTKKVSLKTPLDEFQAQFFNTVYQEGLSQFAFENQLDRNDLAQFETGSESSPTAIEAQSYSGILSLQSGGKDSLLTATLFQEQNPSYLYISSSDNHPLVLDELGGELQIIKREIDKTALNRTGGLNGHVPITYIVESLALIQAIINHQSTIMTSIGREGNEAHAYIGDLAVNHQWSKTWPAEQLMSEYVKRYISPDLHIGSPLRGFSELKIAELFAKKCWDGYGHRFSSCNVANYRQGTNNRELGWCGNCAKCANTYLLFSPFIERTELDSLYANQSLFIKPDLTGTFKGLLGVDGFMKPFECIGEIDELRQAYELRLPSYPELPFSVPESHFDYQKITEMQPYFQNLLNQTGAFNEL